MSDEAAGEDFEIVGSVAPNEVPPARRNIKRSKWALLADRVIADYRAGRVTVLRVSDDAAVIRLRGNIANYLNREHLGARTIVVRDDDEVRVFVEVRPKG